MSWLVKSLAIALIAGFVLVGLLGAWFLRWDEIDPPELPGELVAGSLQHDGRDRSWHLYRASRLPLSPPLVLLLHPSTGDGSYMRASTFYEFDVLAERAGFLVVYPDGFEQHWNDCRGSANYSANTLAIDDVGFIRALVQKLAAEHGADISRVYVAGISNGGQMAYRLAMEAPELVAGIAAVAANLPVEANSDCQASGRPVGTLIINGSDDPVNPHQGGLVEFLGDTSRGEVMSSVATATYWARLAGHQGPGVTQRWPVRAPDDGTSVASLQWQGPAGPAVQLLSVSGGGHSLPHPLYKMPKILGTTSNQLDGAEAIWSFFSSGEPVEP